MKLEKIRELIERWNAGCGWPEAGDEDIIKVYTVLPKLLAVAEAADLEHENDHALSTCTLCQALAALEADES